MVSAVSAVIMAGGKGSRVASLSAAAGGVPKPMLPVCGKPVLEHQLACLSRQGIRDILLVTGHQGGVISGYFGDGRGFDCRLSYYEEDTPLGSAGALFRVRERLADDFLLINGDIVFDIDIPRFLAFHRDGGLPATIAVHPNSHPHDSAVVMTDASGRVTAWLGKDDRRGHCGNQVNAGLHVLSKRLLAGAAPADGIADLDRDILRPLIAGAGIRAYRTPEYIKDMGTPERYRQVEADVRAGLPRRRNLANRQTAVFLDRDGTISRLDGFVTRPEQLRLEEGAAEAVRAVNGAGCLAIVITNQPVIARGECAVETLEEIHRKMEGDLGAEGACLDDIYYCPHHPDRGFAGERPEYKTDCECRKPKPGMILAAARKYNIDLSRSYMIGDDTRDALSGLAAGCRPALIRRSPDRSSSELVGGVEVPVYGSLLEAVTGLLPSQ